MENPKTEQKEKKPAATPAESAEIARAFWRSLQNEQNHQESEPKSSEEK